MNSRYLAEAFRLIDENPALATFVGPRPVSLLETAERAVGLVFPATYREFLLRFGAGAFGRAEFYGVIDDDFESSSAPNGIWVTLAERRLSRCHAICS